MTAKCYLRVVNWDAFQHYGDRMPPWIKLHNTVLEDPVIAALPDHAKAHVFGLWLLASRLKNKIPNDAKFIGSRINATRSIDINLLIFSSFLEHHPECECGASDLLAKCYTDKNKKRVEKEEKRVEETRDSAPPIAGLVLVSRPEGSLAPELSWSNESADDWREFQHGNPFSAQFKPLKRLIREHTWSVVRPRWRRFLEQLEARYVNAGAAARFESTFGAWDGAPARASPKTLGTIRAAEAFVREGESD